MPQCLNYLFNGTILTSIIVKAYQKVKILMAGMHKKAGFTIFGRLLKLH